MIRVAPRALRLALPDHPRHPRLDQRRSFPRQLPNPRDQSPRPRKRPRQRPGPPQLDPSLSSLRLARLRRPHLAQCLRELLSLREGAPRSIRARSAFVRRRYPPTGTFSRQRGTSREVGPTSAPS